MNDFNCSCFMVDKCYVIFEDEVSLWWLKLLKKGFRHCYVIAKLDEKYWVELNPCSNQFFLFFSKIDVENYLNYIKKSKLSVVLEIKGLKSNDKVAPIGLFSCVEFVKRYIGLHSFTTITPYQLYKKIIDCRKKVLTK